MRIDSISRQSDRLQLTWEDGQSSVFHYLWLRDNCGCAECRHPIAGERTLDPVTLPLDIQPAAVALSGGLQITWPDGHETHFTPGWLRANAYEREARLARRPRPTLWSTDLIAQKLPETSYDVVMNDDGGLLTWLRLLRQYGFTIVRGVPTRERQVLALAERVAFLRNSNFGVLFNVLSVPDPNSLAYTSVKLNAHTDLVSREAQPGLQFLHCLVFEAEGGESILVDGFAAAEELRATHRDDFRLLTTTPVPFRYQDRETDVRARFPIIRLDEDGGYYEIRYSTALMAPLDVDPELVGPFYRAFQRYSAILRQPRFEFKFKLQPGDCEVFDNRRVLHGRDAFNPQSGPRHLQGCYVDTDDFLSRLRVLEREGDFRQR